MIPIHVYKCVDDNADLVNRWLKIVKEDMEVVVFPSFYCRACDSYLINQNGDKRKHRMSRDINDIVEEFYRVNPHAGDLGKIVKAGFLVYDDRNKCVGEVNILV